MKKRLLPLLLCILGFIFTSSAQSNLFIDDSYTVEEMVMDFFDNPNITISNVTSSAGNGNGMIGFFDADSTDLGLDAGIVFCSGIVQGAIGPNFSQNFGINIGLPGDDDIDLLAPGAASYDAVTIEFDFTVAQSGDLDFNYVFGSEEYPEFVGSQYNDAFGFFISGPGLNGTYSNQAENISLIPFDMQPVAINNLNPYTNGQFYLDNSNGQHLQYDGYTVPLPATFYAIGGETYHIKMVVSDKGDGIYDSGIFLSFNSLGQDSLLSPTAYFEAVVDANTVDFTNKSKYARDWSWNFGDGQMSQKRHPQPVHYSLPGDYSVYLTASNYCCKDSYVSIVSVDSIAVLTANIATTNNPLNCHGDSNASIDLQVVGATLPLISTTWQPNILDLNNVGEGTYNYTVVDSDNNTFTGAVIISAPNALTLDVRTESASGGLANGTASVNVNGGTPPYSFTWSNGMTSETLEGIPAGEHQVEVMDANGCTSSTTVNIDIETRIKTAQDFQFNLLPNPVKNKLRIEWSDNSNIKQLQVYDVLGKIIPINYENIGSGMTVSFNPSLTKGIYFIVVELEDGRRATSRFAAE